MSHVIKATDRNRGIHGVAFNFDDLSRQASGYLDKIREEASQILVKATQEAEAIRKRAEVDGRKAAEQAVEKRIDQKIAAQMQTLLPALTSAIGQIESSKQGWLASGKRRWSSWRRAWRRASFDASWPRRPTSRWRWSEKRCSLPREAATCAC